MILTPEIKKKYLEQLLTNFIKDEVLSELKIANIGALFNKQKSLNFKKHRQKYQELQSKGIRPKFKDFENGVALYTMKSAEWDQVKRKNVTTEYLLGIRFIDWNKFYDDPMMSMQARVEKLMKGNLGIGCSCPSFRFHYGYQTHLKGADFYDERFSNNAIDKKALVRNPSNIGIGCKHLDRLLNAINYRFDIKRDILNKIKSEAGTKQSPISPSAPNSKQAQKKRK